MRRISRHNALMKAIFWAIVAFVALLFLNAFLNSY